MYKIERLIKDGLDLTRLSSLTAQAVKHLMDYSDTDDRPFSAPYKGEIMQLDENIYKMHEAELIEALPVDSVLRENYLLKKEKERIAEETRLKKEQKQREKEAAREANEVAESEKKAGEMSVLSKIQQKEVFSKKELEELGIFPQCPKLMGLWDDYPEHFTAHGYRFSLRKFRKGTTYERKPL